MDPDQIVLRESAENVWRKTRDSNAAFLEMLSERLDLYSLAADRSYSAYCFGKCYCEARLLDFLATNHWNSPGITSIGVRSQSGCLLPLEYRSWVVAQSRIAEGLNKQYLHVLRLRWVDDLFKKCL